jgi:hypothetical protein
VTTTVSVVGLKSSMIDPLPSAPETRPGWNGNRNVLPS